MLTYQDYLSVKENPEKLTEFVRSVISKHISSELYKTAEDADEYDAERNVGIAQFLRMLITGSGQQTEDKFASNIKLTSNFFRRLNIQRCTYSLGNGLTFQDESIMEKLGANADTAINSAGYYALIHGLSFLYWTGDHIHTFTTAGTSSFAPLWDEDTSGLGAGVRFWRIADNKPLHATLYTPDGYIEYASDRGGGSDLRQTGELVPYRWKASVTPATSGDVATAHNYSGLPIVPLWGSRLHQSTLVGMRSKIDAYDMVNSGFANDLADCAQIYWIINGAGGMSDDELSKFRNKLLLRHIADVDTDNVNINPYTQEIPYEARTRLLDRLRAQIYEDFGALDVSNVSASARTATEIRAAYQPMDENADDFEYQIIDAMQNLLGLLGVPPEDATPQFKRNRVANQMEEVQLIMLEAPYLDDETILKKLPNISSEETEEIMKRKAAEEMDRVSGEPENEEEETEIDDVHS